jgi:hypothetical protein
MGRGKKQETAYTTKMVALFCIGILMGMVLGWMLLGTSQAMLEVRLSSSMKAPKPLKPITDRSVHVLMTSGGGAYQNFQTRVMYSTFQKVQGQPGGGQHLVAFTRILHRTKADRLMDEVPTFHAVPLQPKCDDWCEFPPASRPDAVFQFFKAAKTNRSLLQAPWVFMTECDYVWIKPLQAPPASNVGKLSMAFPFGYISPTYPTVQSTMRIWYPPSKGPLTDIPGTGPAPALMRTEEWDRILPDWVRITAEIEENEQAKDKLGWVREMYAFSLACALQGVKLQLDLPPQSTLMVQPPADHKMGEAPIMHYTWGSIISNSSGDEVWRFDKREYGEEWHEVNPPRLPEPPPYEPEAGWRLQDKVAVTEDLRNTLFLMIRTMNEAIDGLKPLA